ncbi:MAG TPA: hypothetical protein VJ841_01665 [Candidatus Saccharimonadales bacterium]|nr:hypothetical protein [Candidatus Saccharimonadales bacterium]
MCYTAYGYKTRSTMLDERMQDLLIQQFKLLAGTWCDNNGTRLRIFRVGPSRTDTITLQDGEFSARSATANDILIQGFKHFQQPTYKNGVVYYSIRMPAKRIYLSSRDFGTLRSSVSQEPDRPSPPKAAIDQGLVTIEIVGDHEIVRLTPEGWDALRLYLAK